MNPMAPRARLRPPTKWSHRNSRVGFSTHPCSQRCRLGRGSGLPRGFSQPGPGLRSGCGLRMDNRVSGGGGARWQCGQVLQVPCCPLCSEDRDPTLPPQDACRAWESCERGGVWGVRPRGQDHLGPLATGHLPHPVPEWASLKAWVTRFQMPRPDSGLASWEKYESLLTFCNSLLQGKML